MIFRSKVWTIAENRLSSLIEKSAISDEGKNALFDPIHFSEFVDTMHLQVNKLELKLGILVFDGARAKAYVERRVTDYISWRVKDAEKELDGSS